MVEESEIFVYGDLEVKEIIESESAFVFIAQRKDTDDKVVIKKLKPLKDSRYSLGTPKERQHCLIEGLKWNRRFTPGVYIGLGRIHDVATEHTLYLDPIIENPEEHELDPNAEYGLVMRYLPESNRLDILLKQEGSDALRVLILRLIDALVEAHEHIATLPVILLDEEGAQWGSVEQLRRKLEHNMNLLELIPNVMYDADYPYHELKDVLHNALNNHRFAQYVEQRVQENYIKRCHGDLKSSNIWIDQQIHILDAVDFNGAYCNIDVLSDLALLVVDVQAHLLLKESSPLTLQQSIEFGEYMIESYLERTNQKDDVARTILAYYLVEKIIVGAAVSIYFDRKFDLGKAFFRISRERIKKLMYYLEHI